MIIPIKIIIFATALKRISIIKQSKALCIDGIATALYIVELTPASFRSADRNSRKIEQKPLEVFTCNSACTETWFELLIRHRRLEYL